MLYPLLLVPTYKDYLWGGTRLKEKYHKDSDLRVIAESWELSTHPEGISRIANGAYAGRGLDAYIREEGPSVLGEGMETLPLLVKLIDTADTLSVQVHPDDGYARRNEGQQGKTELWYIMDCEQGASLLCGMKRALSRETFVQKALDGSIVQEMNRIAVSPGDVFLIQPGTVHAIGKNMTVVEIGTNSNITYRIHDFGRLGVDGAPRPLHIEQAADVLRTGGDAEKGKARQLDCGPFSMAVLEVAGQKTLRAGSSFQCLVSTKGAADVNGVPLAEGAAMFIPAGLGEYTVSGSATLLLVTP